jgi:sterol desaturase/sphingolipid hydroxylase (fatty acid hydroxylase superfamily)
LTRTDIIIGLIFIALLFGTTYLQTTIGLKDEPQGGMLIFSGLTLLTFLIRQDKIATVLFYIIFGTMLYINFFLLTNEIIDILNPDRGWIEIDGERRRVMDVSWVLGVIVGLLLAPLTVLLYHKKIKRNRMVEIATTTIFLIVTTIIYLT